MAFIFSKLYMSVDYLQIYSGGDMKRKTRCGSRVVTLASFRDVLVDSEISRRDEVRGSIPEFIIA